MATTRTLPDTGFLRLKQIIGDPEADPPIPALIPVSSSTWWAGVKNGKYPPSVCLSAKVTGWSVENIKALIEKINSEGSI